MKKNVAKRNLKVSENFQSVIITDEFKAELDRRVEYYLSGGKMVTPEEMSARLKAARERRKDKKA